MVQMDQAGSLYKGMITFVIILLIKNIPFVLLAAPERCYLATATFAATWLHEPIDSNWLMEQFLKCIDCSHRQDIMSETYQKPLLKYAMDSNYDLRICIKGKPIYLFQDSVNITKIIRNNLLNRKKKLIFLPFSCDSLKAFLVEVNPLTPRRREVSPFTEISILY